MLIKALTALIPCAGKETQVAAVPYDVVDTEEARTLAMGIPESLLHVDRAEIDLPVGQNPYDDIVYETAAKNFQRLIKEGVLVREDKPALYLYQQQMGAHVQTGIIAGCHIDDYETDKIRKHEKTRKDKEEDRTKLVDRLSAHTGPIFLTFKDTPEIVGAMNEILQTTKPLFDFTAPDGIAHRVWRVTEGAQKFVDWFSLIERTYIADGHHRSASAWRVGKHRRKGNPNHTGTEEYNWMLGVLFPASQLQILPYNRLVADLHGSTPAEFLAKLKAAGITVEETSSPIPGGSCSCCMHLDGKWWKLRWALSGSEGPVKSLDVSVLQDRILDPLLGIDDPRTNKRVDFVGGIRGTQELEKRVKSGTAAVAFSMHPVTVRQLMDIADANEIMPPKSTWFEPKLRSGLVIQTFEPQA